MLSEEAKKTIDALSKEELRREIDKKNQSSFQGDKYAYLQTRLTTIDQQEQNKHRQEDVAHREEELSLAWEANQISQKTNKLSKIAIAVSIIAALIALGALIINVWSSGKSNAP